MAEAERRPPRARNPWVDVPEDHDPDPPPREGTFAHGVGLDGYERDTGGKIAKRPGLRRPGENEPVASPFDE